MAAKKRLFRRAKPPIGDKSEKPREKRSITKKKATSQTALPKPAQTSQKPKQSLESPNIYRFISEKVRIHSQKLSNWSWKKTGIGLIAGILLCCIVMSGVLLLKAGENLIGVLGERGKLQDEQRLWEDIAKKYPNYRDADFQVAILAYQLGDRQTEQTYLQRVLQIDPNYQPALMLQGKN